MKAYHDLLQKVLDEGEEVTNERTGVGTIALFGEQIKFDMRKGFPAVTTKKLAFKAMIAELLWFIRGSDNLNDLRALTHGEENRFNTEKKTIWDDNYNVQGKQLGYKDGYCGLIYGTQWRRYGLNGVYVEQDFGGTYYHNLPKVDQLAEMIKEAQTNPGSRRLLVYAWNPQLIWEHDVKSDTEEYDIDKPILPPCHVGFQINISGDYIDMIWEQRSVDCGLGLPFNIASYATLLHILGRILNKTPRYLTGQFGDTHVYKNHIEPIKEQLTREHFALPTLSINENLKTLKDFETASVSDFELNGYKHHSTVKMIMAA
ncbi:dTMP thymidylate synthetase [Acinetobacter phage vB_AbaM_Kimel]|uniref:thymidylate synthase n=3 Tax=Lazarusvirus kimel TaxID=2843635 RepID=A0A6B9LN80_9CAUD|nr:dTMP thymidylate synthetase [Acinetobacter phage vB_AbaM_Kimel]QHB48382.1 dTMP thymidylate synthetase [Acinetobacter phage vB_AbaM_Kimel]QKE55924.1 dTMP thymidylate synthetase [Acinetobacter phage Octan]QNO11344.1 dTMP thymidylate synthetase [Acinetobacter phage Meroveus]